MISGKFELKLLILFVSEQAGAPLGFAELAELVLLEESVDYFAFSDGAAELARSGHLSRFTPAEDGPPLYFISQKGRETLETCEKQLARSVRTIAGRASLELAAKKRRDAAVRADYKLWDSGEQSVACSLSDDHGHVMSLDLMVLTREQADMLADAFREKAEKLYNIILKSLLGEEEDNDADDTQ